MSGINQRASNFSQQQDLLKDLIQCSFLGRTPRTSDSVGLGWGPGIYMFKLPADADAEKLSSRTTMMRCFRAGGCHMYETGKGSQENTSLKMPGVRPNIHIFIGAHRVCRLDDTR